MGIDKLYINGGDGNDIITTRTFDETTENIVTKGTIFGGDGDDYIEGAHKGGKSSLIQGNAGNDKIIMGDEIEGSEEAQGGNHDDIIYGGN